MNPPDMDNHWKVEVSCAGQIVKLQEDRNLFESILFLFYFKKYLLRVSSSARLV